MHDHDCLCPECNEQAAHDARRAALVISWFLIATAALSAVLFAVSLILEV